MKKNNIKGAVLVSAAALSWGIFPAITRCLYSMGADPLSAAVMRCIICAVIYLVYGIAKGVFRTLTVKETLVFIAMSLFTVVGMYIFYLLAIKEVSTAMAAMLLYTAPAFVIIFDRIFYKEKITKGKVLSLILTVIGCALVVQLYDFKSVSLNLIGIVYGLLAGISYSMVTVFGKRMLKHHSSDTVAVMPVLCGAVVLMCIKPVWTVPVYSPQMMLAYIALALIGSVIPFLLYNKGLETGLDGGKASIIATIEPVAATITGVLIFADSLELIQILGMALVIIGAALQIKK